MKYVKWVLYSLLALAIAAVSFPIAALADPDGSEIQITDQPDQLILQLGPQWAGTQFELKTDAGIYPAPVVVDESGILRMDLGGSKTYILSCVSAGVTVPSPQPTEVTTVPPATSALPAPEDTHEANQPKVGIPAGELALFLSGLVLAMGGLLAMRYFKHRRKSDDDYDDEDN